MKTGFRGTFVISWTQTEVDGLLTRDTAPLRVGANWRWSGRPVRVDGPSGLLVLDGAKGMADLRKRAARTVRRLVGAALTEKTLNDVDETDATDPPLMDSGFVLTDGRATYTATLIDVAPGTPPLLMFLNELPPQETDLWVVRCSLKDRRRAERDGFGAGVICFTPGTMIRTPDGPRPVEELHEGDRVSTKDDGAQQIHWIGQRRMSGARLYAMPDLRPVRIRAGALGEGEPEGDLLVSPQHRLLIGGAAAQMLFNTPEVLVTARDLVNDHNILVDHTLREVTYIHLLLERHQVLWANGIETESFHPANAALATIETGERARLLALLPEVANDPQAYGSYVRRNLSPSEAEILKYDSIVHH